MVGITLSESLIYQIIQKDGARFKEFVESHGEERWRKAEVPEQTEVVVFSADGVNACFREASEAKGKQPVECDEHGMQKPKAQGSCYKNIMMGAISLYKTMQITESTGENSLVPHRLNSYYIAQMPEENFPTFRARSVEAINCLRAQFPKKGVLKLLLMDGARPLWKWVEKEECFKDFDFLLDFYHGSQHLSAASEALFGSKQCDEAKRWYEKWKEKLKTEEGAVGGLIRSIDYHIAAKHLGGKRKAAADKERQFFFNNQDIMNYAIYAEIGMPIGSGPVEAACKTIVKERMCRSGMRWDRQRGGYVLNLGVIRKSDQWDAMWDPYSQERWNVKSAA